MAGSATTELRVKVGVTGDKNLTKLSRSLSNLGRLCSLLITGLR